MILEVNNLTKKYGRKAALDDITFSVDEGRVVGLLGPNGSGKTTLIKIITNLIKTYQGDVLINGEKPSAVTKAFVSYLPDRNILQDHMKIEDTLKIYRDFFPDYNHGKALQLLDDLNLDLNQKVGALSKGMVEKLHLALVLSRDSKLYVLDEPIAGVDLLTRKQILKMIIANISDDSTMLITTHLVEDMEKIFDEVVFLDDGKIVLQGICEQLIEQHGKPIHEIYEEIYGGLYRGQID